MSDKCRRPRRDALAADQLPVLPKRKISWSTLTCPGATRRGVAPTPCRSREGEHRYEISIALLKQSTQFMVRSCDEGTPFPNLHDYPDLDDLDVEGRETKQFWRDTYKGLELWRKELNYN
jgi:hypothetical protein